MFLTKQKKCGWNTLVRVFWFSFATEIQFEKRNKMILILYLNSKIFFKSIFRIRIVRLKLKMVLFIHSNLNWWHCRKRQYFYWKTTYFQIQKWEFSEKQPWFLAKNTVFKRRQHVYKGQISNYQIKDFEIKIQMFQSQKTKLKYY